MSKMKVQLRGGFSDRNNIKPENTTIQTTSLDVRTRVALANVTSIVCNRRFNNFEYAFNDNVQRFVKHLLSDVYGIILDWSTASSPDTAMRLLKETIQEDDYDSVLTVVEYLVQVIDDKPYSRIIFENESYTAARLYNNVFEREYVGYRIVHQRVTPITDPVEISSIEDAFETQYNEVKQHIEKALGLMSDREAPDYANSIKESITAVERMCSIIVGQATTLGDALKKLAGVGVEIHPALKGAFEKLYGYTSDASGLRHAGQLGGKDATFEEAKFMLVSCCAFVNYLTGVVAKTEK